jgi:hypothetical protein
MVTLRLLLVALAMSAVMGLLAVGLLRRGGQVDLRARRLGS